MKNKLLLISMPWPFLFSPSNQITTLQKFLKQHNIEADVRSLYVPFADIIGLQKYVSISELVLLAEAVFAVQFYPQMKNKAMACLKNNLDNRYNIDNLFIQTEQFMENVIKEISFSHYKYIGFSVVFNQVFSSLALARRIKKTNPNIKIIFGGDNCRTEKGISLMKAFLEIDYIISYEGEYPLLHLMKGVPPKDIYGLTYRHNGNIVINQLNNDLVSLNKLPIPDFTEYFNRINETKDLKRKKEFLKNIRIPVETNRSCWWNKCTFCSNNTQYQKYREKSNANIINEIKTQIKKYRIRNISFNSNNINLIRPKELFCALKPFNLQIKLYYSARIRNFNLLQHMKEAGVTIIGFGLESLSNSLLENKIKKGTRVIDNIQMMKWLRELNIKCNSGLIIGYPNETKKEFYETIHTFKFIHHLEPPFLNDFVLFYGSPIFNNSKIFNIKNICPDKDYSSFIPQEVLKKLIFNCYNFQQKTKRQYPQSILLKEYRKWLNLFINNSSYPLLYYKIKNGLLKITDRRKINNFDYVFGKQESDIYLFCHSIRNLNEIYKQFPSLTKKNILDMLNYLVKEHIMFKDGKDYISLAIDLNRYKKYLLKDGVKRHKFSNRMSTSILE